MIDHVLRVVAIIGCLVASLAAFAPPIGAAERHDVTEFAAACDGRTDDRAAFASANAAGAFTVSAGTCAISSNLTISSPVTFSPPGQIRPASGVTVAFTGPIISGTRPIFDLSAGGTVNIAAAQVDGGTPCEWFGCIGGDSSYVAGHAGANKRAIDAVLANAPPGPVWFHHCGYSTTGHILDGSHARMIDGCGGGASRATFYGSGIAWAHASSSSTGDPCKTENFVFQNGSGNNGTTVIQNTTIAASGTGVSALGVCWYADSYLWRIVVNNSYLNGDYGAVIEWSNGVGWDNDSFAGSICGIDLYVPASPRTGGTVQKLNVRSTTISGTTRSSGTVLCETNETAYPPDLGNIVWDTDDFSYAAAGLVLAGYGQQFITPNVETLGSGPLVIERGSAVWSRWIDPIGQGGVVLSRFLGPGALSTRSELKSANEDWISAGNLMGIITGLGSPNGTVYAGRGSVYYRSDASDVSQSPCYQFSNSPANTGWKNAAGGEC